MTHISKSFALALVLGFFLVQASHAIIRHSGADDQAYIDYGNQFNSTVLLAFNDVYGDRWTRGSCVIIDDGHWAITAAHCIRSTSSSPDVGVSYTAITGPNPWDEKGPEHEYFVADQWWVHPDFVNSATGPDLALLYFEEAITGLTPATRFRGVDTLNSSISIVGYGRSGTPSMEDWPNPPIYHDYIRRGCKAPITSGLGTDIKGGASFLSGGGLLNGKASGGDSGGAWYIDVNGMEQLMGITSTSNDRYPSYGVSWATRLSLFNDWVDGIQVTMVPEPAMAILLAIGGAFLFVLRKKRKA